MFGAFAVKDVRKSSDMQGLGVGMAKVRRRWGNPPRVRRYALATASIIPFLALSAAAAPAQPTGASVVAGQAQISSSGATTLVNQSTAKAIINWQDFSVGAGAAVQFNQPSASAITLNRVTGSNISTIDGAIRANGQVWLLNPNGLLFGNGATINVGGLLATTSDIADQDFINGRYNFSGGQGGIVNNGSIKAASGGSVVLSAPNVTNNGLIVATAGHVVLGGTDTFTVDFNGDHLLSYAVSTSSQTGQVTNTGKISAAGGQILLTARAAAGVQDAVINNTGMIEATSVRSVNGEIILDAGDGTATNAGTLDASGKAAGETGGTVKMLGQQVAVADGARIDVSGDAGGGTALIGGNLHGAGPEPNAQNTTVGKATINASAITSGNGGTVAVYSTGHTEFVGTITAQGGIVSGNGGQVETSGHTLHVADEARVVTLAPHGTPGDWLLDPDNITIDAGEAGSTNQTFSTTGSVLVGANAIRNALGSGNVTLQANVDITVNSAINATTNNTLELDAGHSIILNASITNLGSTGGSILLYAGNPNATGGSQSGAVISAASGVTLTANSFGLAVGTAGGAIGTSALPILLSGSAPSSAIGLQINTNGGNAFVQSSSLANICSCVITPTGGTFLSTIAGVNLGTGNFTLTSSPGLTINAPLNAGGLITLTTTTGGITQNTAAATDVHITTATGLTVNSAGNVVLNDSGNTSVPDVGNQISGVVNFVTSGNFTLYNTVTTTTGALPGAAGPTSSSVTGVNIQVFDTVGGTGHNNLVLNDTVSTTGNMLLSASGNIVNYEGHGGLVAPNFSFFSGFGTIGALDGVASTPFALGLSTPSGGTVAFQAQAPNGDVNLASFATGQVGVSSTAMLDVGSTLSPLVNGLGPGLLGNNVSLSFANGSINQLPGATGVISATNLTATTGSTGSLFLASSNNVIGNANLFVGSIVTLYDTGNLTLSAVRGATGPTSIPTGALTVQTTGTLALKNVTDGSITVLHAGGAISSIAGTGTAVQASSLSLISDNGSIGTTTAPLNIVANLLAARTSNGGNIDLSAVPLSGTALTLTTITSGTNGNIGSTNNNGLNALNGGNILVTGNGAMSFGGNTIAAGNLQLAGFTTINVSGVGVGSLSASATGAINISTLGAVQINNLTGGVGIQTPGVVTLNTLGNITSASGIAGSIAAGGLTASVNAGGSFGIFLGDGMNAVTGSVTLNAPGPITFFNSVNTNIFRANYIPASTALPAQSVDIEAFGASTPTLTIGTGANQNGTSIYGNIVTLRGMGGIVQSGTGQVAGSNIALLSGGTIGTATAPIQVQANGNALVANTANKDINLAFLLPQGVTSSQIQLGQFTGTGLSTIAFSAGTGNINISAPSIDVNGFTTITANSLNISSSASVELDDAEVNFVSAAASAGGSIDINSLNGFQLSNPNGGPAISTTGDASLSVSSGSITQAAGASGAITAGTFSSFAVGGNNFNNPANAISGDIEIGSLANTTLVNSLTTNLVVALASGTLTVQSAGDLVLVASPTIAGLSAASAASGTNFKGTSNDTSNDTGNGNGNGGISVNGTVVVTAAALSQLNGDLVSLASSGDGIVLAAGGSFINDAGAAALLLPNGARFLVYANQFSTSVLGGLTTVGDGIFNTSYPAPITASGSRFIFAGSGSLTFTTASTPSDVLHDNTTTAPVVVGFVTALQPPPRSPPPPPAPPPPLSDLLTVATLQSPPPPPPPPVQSPLADNNSEQPVSSDQTTSQVANSLDGSTPRPGPRGSGGAVIPRMLVNARPPTPPPTDATALSSFGNSSLWQ